MITIKQKGDFKRTEKFLKKMTKLDFNRYLDRYGLEGTYALMTATPIDSAKTASSWDYEVRNYPSKGYASVTWTNSNVNKGVNIAIILQYGHGTRNGGYVQGRDYINPALQPVFDKMAEAAWREVTNA